VMLSVTVLAAVVLHRRYRSQHALHAQEANTKTSQHSPRDTGTTVTDEASYQSPTYIMAGGWDERARHRPVDSNDSMRSTSFSGERRALPAVPTVAPSPEAPGWQASRRTSSRRTIASTNGRLLSTNNSGRVAPTSDHGASGAPRATAIPHTLRVNEPGGPTTWVKPSVTFGNRRASEPGTPFQHTRGSLRSSIPRDRQAAAATLWRPDEDVASDDERSAAAGRSSAGASVTPQRVWA
jgi:hypothetical protein